MRILVAGATGVLGRATLPHLDRHEVIGLTRKSEKLQLVRDLGAEGLLCDVYDYPTLLDLTQQTQPQIVVNFITELSKRSAKANIRARREGAANLHNAAKAANASRLVVESVAFALTDEAAKALEELEQSTCRFPGEALILRFGRLWGPDTWHQTPAEPPTIHIDKAGAEASRLLVEAPPGTYVVS
jgi:nucleoside-diphosphate-sugar epimerase